MSHVDSFNRALAARNGEYPLWSIGEEFFKAQDGAAERVASVFFFLFFVSFFLSGIS